MLKKCNTWDSRFFALTNLVAVWSVDESRKVGCVIVDEANGVRSIGFNSLPRKVSDTSERHSKQSGAKYLWFEHAERNAIYELTRTGISASGCRMYVNSFPCSDCARAIIQSGIVELRTFDFDQNDQYFDKHFVVAKEMFQEAGVDLRLYDRRDPAISSVHSNLSVALSGVENWFR